MSTQLHESEVKELTTTRASPNPSLGNILVVDDEPELKTILVESIRKQGYEVTGCSSAIKALAEMREQNFDLLLTDLMMPEMDGIALLRATLEIDPHVVGIMMTGQGTIQTAVDAMKLGAFDYVLKPFRMQTLMPVLTRAMNVRHLRLENVHLRETVAIYGLSQTIAFTLDPQTVLSKLADAALEQSNADEVSILLPTHDGKELYVAMVRGEKRERLLGERIPLENSIASWMARERTPLILNGEVRDERFVSLWPRADIRSAISVPMQVANKLVGIINLNVTSRLRPFTLGQMKALTILAGTAASALESASLYTQVKQAEKNYRSIFENAVEGIFQASPEGRFTTANPALARILGYESPDELIATVTDITQQLYVDPEIRAEAARLEDERGVLLGFEFEAFRKDGEKIWLSANRRAVKDENGVEIYREGTLEDITERKQLEEALIESEEKLRQSQKLEAIGQLAGGVAHDFNNLLTVIGGYSSILLNKLPQDSPHRASVEEIKKAGDRAGALTRQLLAFSRKQILQPKVLDLNVVVTDLEKMVRRLIGEDIDLLTITSPVLGKVKADPGQIEQVLLNLIVNARDAMPKGGKLTIETRNVEHSEEYAQRHAALPGSYVMLAVSDTGCGMAATIQPRIFEPFFTTKASGKGTGLGLSTVYGIVRQSGGNIWVYSEVGRGSTFKIYLPRVDDAGEETAALTSGSVPKGTELILLVEDEDQVRAILKQILEGQGYQVLAASNGEEALSISRDLERDIKLMITDVVMPQMSGRELAERVLALRPSLPVLFMSGYTDDAIVRHGLLDEKLNFIQKPFDSRHYGAKGKRGPGFKVRAIED